MKKILLSLAALMIAATSYAETFGPAFNDNFDVKTKSLGVEIKSVKAVKLVGIFDNKNGNGAIQKPLQSFDFQGVKAYTTATLSTNADVDKAYAGASAMVKLGKVVPGVGIDAGVTVRGAELSKSLRVDNSFSPTVALDIDPETLVRHIISTPSRVEQTFRNWTKKVF